MSTPCAPSPPSDFCQLKVAISIFDQGIGIAKQAEVASAIVKPSLSSGIQLPSGTFTPEVVPFQVKRTSREKSTSSREGRCPQSASKTRQSSNCNCLVTSFTHVLPNDSHARISTPRCPKSDQITISTAPVSEPGTIPRR